MPSQSSSFGLYNTDAALWHVGNFAGKTVRIVGGCVYIGRECLARFPDIDEAVATLRAEGWTLTLISDHSAELCAMTAPAASIVPPSQPSPGALRAARYVAEMIRTTENALSNAANGATTPAQRWEARDNAEQDAARVIDRETGAGELAAAMLDLLGTAPYGTDGMGWKVAKDQAREILARYAGK
jgi:hypothetical protein